MLSWCLQRLKSKSDVRRKEAIERLATCNSEPTRSKAIAALLWAVSHEDQYTRREARSSLERLNWIPQTLAARVYLGLAGDHNRLVALDSTVYAEYVSYKEDFDSLLKMFRTSGVSPDLHAMIRGASSVDHILPDIVPALCNALRHDSPDVRYQAATVLIPLADRRCRNSLLEALHDTDERVIKRVTLSLGVFRDPGLTDTLLALLDFPDHNVRHNAILALGRSADRTAIAPIGIQLRKDEINDVQKVAARTLAQFGGTDAGRELVSALRTPNLDYYTSKYVVESLTKVCDEQCRTDLIGMLDDDKIAFRAVEVLTNIKWCPTSEDERLAFARARMDFEELAKHNGPGIEVIRRYIDRDVRNVFNSRVVSTLVSVGGDQARAVLISGFKRSLRCDATRLHDFQCAARGIAELGGEGAVDALAAGLGVPQCRVAAAEALRQLGSEEAIDALVSELDSPDSDVRYEVAAVLADLGKTVAIAPMTDYLTDVGRSLAAFEYLSKLGWEGACLADLWSTPNPPANDDAIISRAIEVVRELDDNRIVEFLVARLPGNARVKRTLHALGSSSVRALANVRLVKWEYFKRSPGAPRAVPDGNRFDTSDLSRYLLLKEMLQSDELLAGIDNTTLTKLVDIPDLDWYDFPGYSDLPELRSVHDDYRCFEASGMREAARNELARRLTEGLVSGEEKDAAVGVLLNNLHYFSSGDPVFDALAFACDDRVKPRLLDMLNRHSWRAAEVLRRTGWIPTNDGERLSAAIAERDFSALASLGCGAVPILSEWVNSRFETQTECVVETLVQIGGDEAVEALKSALDNPQAIDAIKQGLADLGHPDCRSKAEDAAIQRAERQRLLTITSHIKRLEDSIVASRGCTVMLICVSSLLVGPWVVIIAKEVCEEAFGMAYEKLSGVDYWNSEWYSMLILLVLGVFIVVPSVLIAQYRKKLITRTFVDQFNSQFPLNDPDRSVALQLIASRPITARLNGEFQRGTKDESKSTGNQLASRSRN